MQTNKFILTLAAGLCFLGLQEVRANHIDFMQDAPFTQTGAGNQDATGSSANILGTVRDVTVAGTGTASLAGSGPLVYMTGNGGSLTLGYGTAYGGAAYT